MSDEIVDGVAVFRLTRLVVADQFPPVKRARERILQRWPATDWRVELLTCPWCVSFWIALVVVALRRFVPRVWRPASRAFAFSAVAGMLSEKF